MPKTNVKTRDQTRPAVATPRRMDVAHGSGERTAGVAVAAIQDILRREDYRPQFLKDLIKACQTANLTLPSPEAIIINGKPYSVRSIREHLAKFVYMLPPEKRPAFDDNSLYDDSFLTRLSGIIDEVSGLASPEPTAEAGPPPANIPPDLKALVAEFEAAHQSAAAAQAKRHGWSPEKFREQIALQNQITIQMAVVRQASLSQLGLVIDNSQYLENLAAGLSVQPEAVKRLAKIRLQTLVDQAITAQTFRQARLISKDPSQLAALFTKNLSDNLKLDDLVGTAIAANKKYTKKAAESIKKIVTEETEKAKPAIAAAAENLEAHPSVQTAAQPDAVAAVKQVETVSLGRTDPKQQLDPKKSARLVNELKKQPNPVIRRRIIANALKISASQATLVEASLDPAISNFAASTKKLNPLLAADPDSIAADALRRPNLFPKPFVDAIKSGKITDAQVAEIFQMSRLLGVPANAVILSRWGVNAQNLAARLQTGPKFLGFIPIGHGLDSKDTTIAKLSDLAAAQKQLADSLKTPPPLLPPQIPQQFLKTAAGNSRAVRFSDFFQNINIFRLPSAFSYNLGRIPPLGSLGSSGSAFVSGLRVQSGPINSFFNFISSAGNAVRQTPSFLAAPFRAIGSAISNTIINPVKTWAGTQIKSGLAKAGAWLAKKGVTEAAKKIGVALIGKGTAVLLAQAVPVVGQIAGAMMLLSTLGDIGKFIWQNRKTIGLTLGGLFFLGNMLLGKLFAAISSLTNILGFAGLGAGIGFMVGGPFGALIGGVIGGLVGWGINAAGGLGAALSGLGSALGGAAASLSSFIGALTAPSTFIGLGSTVATAGLLGVGLAWAIQTFFIQPNINSALFVPPDEGTFPPGGPQPPFPRPTPPTGGIATPCPEGGKEITNELASRIRNGVVMLLPDTINARNPEMRICITPTMIVMHWSAGVNDNPEGNERTYSTLVTRGLACQLATDTNDTWLMQPFYETQVEMPACAGEWNIYSINNEMTGVSFSGNPPPPNLEELELAYDATCTVMQQYQIPWCQIYGHFEVPYNGGKTDPGEEFLYNVFVPEIRSRCPNNQGGVCSQ